MRARLRRAMTKNRTAAATVIHGDGAQATTLLGSLGVVRETRLTAALAYLAAHAPHEFTAALSGTAVDVGTVRIEHRDDDRRYDIVLETSQKRIVIEAKVGFLQRLTQITSYVTSFRGRVDLVMLDRGSDRFDPTLRLLKERLPKRCRLLSRTWGDVAEVCRSLALRRGFRQRYPLAAALASDLAATIEEKDMDNRPSREIYVRQLSGGSLELFFRHHVYKCQAKFGPGASQHRYFAPLFTAKAPGDMARVSPVPIKAGLSWIAEVKASQTLRRKDLALFFAEHEMPDPEAAAAMVRKQTKDQRIFVMALTQPFSLFTVPLSSKALGLRGMLGPRSLTFGELFERTTRLRT